MSNKHDAPQVLALQQVMSAKRYEVTPFEADIWNGIIDSVSEARFMAFLKHHYLTSPFAPQPSDATKFLDTSANSKMALINLQALVKDLGPWREPNTSDPILIGTINLLGGWAKVNEDMPNPNSLDFKRFSERFDACFNQSVVDVRIENRIPVPLKCLSTSTTALLLDSSKGNSENRVISYERIK